ALTASACASGTVPAARSAGGGEVNAAGRANDMVKAPPAPAATSAKSAKPVVPAGMVTTNEQARKVFNFYVIRTAKALASGNMNSALGQTQGVPRHELSTAIATAKYNHTKVAPFQYGDPTFYIPSLRDYPDWFVVSVKRTAPPGARPDLAGIPQAATGQTLMLFQKMDSGRRWQLSGDVQLQPGQPVPQLKVTNADGGAEAEPLDDEQSYFASPDVVGPLQAAVVDEGPTAPAMSAVAAGPLTTGLYQEQANANPENLPNTGQWSLQGMHTDRVALRTADGGVLVLYPTYLDTTATGQALTVPPGFLPLLPGKAAGKSLSKISTQYMLMFAAIDPPASAKNSKVQIIGIGGAPSTILAS
ncbi:MAG: hypothetical protein J2P26_01950, partial [Nocardiopsaceae bacterium]|nr:hypothetical protein [Nocardiopsaceae bacterium]